MEKKYSVIQIKTTENSETVQKIDLESPYLSLHQLYEWTNCDCISIIHADQQLFKDIMMPFTNVLIVLDDNGKIDQRPENNLGTILYGAFPYDFLVGDIVLCTDERPKTDDEPDAFAFTEDQASLIMSRIMKIMQMTT